MRGTLAAIAMAGVAASLSPVAVFGQIERSTGQTAVKGKPGGRFQVEEATIEDVQRAIQEGRTTCTDVVHAYLERARAYNGICTQLVTVDGKPVAPKPGVVRAGSPVRFPSATTAVSTVLPIFDQYAGLPIEFGRMEAT